jgi:metal-sulfur cluster biosynthetic enzyme
MSEQAAGSAILDSVFGMKIDVETGAGILPEDVVEVLRQCYDPELPVNIVDLGLIYELHLKPKRVDLKMTLTALGCPMAAEVISDVRDHLLAIEGVEVANVDIVYEPAWSPDRMTEDARWELGMV